MTHARSPRPPAKSAFDERDSTTKCGALVAAVVMKRKRRPSRPAALSGHRGGSGRAKRSGRRKRLAREEARIGARDFAVCVEAGVTPSRRLNRAAAPARAIGPGARAREVLRSRAADLLRFDLVQHPVLELRLRADDPVEPQRERLDRPPGIDAGSQIPRQ